MTDTKTTTGVKGGIGESTLRPDGVPKVTGNFAYVSDLFAVPFCTTLTAIIRGEKSRYNEVWAVLFGVMFTLLEFEGTRDPLDVACYWIGAAMAWSAVRFAPE